MPNFGILSLTHANNEHKHIDKRILTPNIPLKLTFHSLFKCRCSCCRCSCFHVLFNEGYKHDYTPFLLFYTHTHTHHKHTTSTSSSFITNFQVPPNLLQNSLSWKQSSAQSAIFWFNKYHNMTSLLVKASHYSFKTSVIWYYKEFVEKNNKE